MSGVRFLKDLKTPTGEALIYVYMDNEGWFSLRQLVELFFPDRTASSIKLTVWCSKNIRSCEYYRTELSKCHIISLRNVKIEKILQNMMFYSEYFIDIQSTKILLHILDPHVSAKLLMKFNKVLNQMLRKGGRKRAVSSKERMKIAASQDWKCNGCGDKFGHDLNFEIDHIFQWCAGGSNRTVNLQALCPNCHSTKSEKDKQQVFEEFKCLSV